MMSLAVNLREPTKEVCRYCRYVGTADNGNLRLASAASVVEGMNLFGVAGNGFLGITLRLKLNYTICAFLLLARLICTELP